uniref:Putative secreted protein n=1 Tax=Ixodes ricinus TaxID=34613 RepID=A0A6B0UAB0_IXORI
MVTKWAMLRVAVIHSSFFLVAATILVPGAEQAQLLRFSDEKRDFLSFECDVRKARGMAFCCFESFQRFWRTERRFLRLQIKASDTCQQ